LSRFGFIPLFFGSTLVPASSINHFRIMAPNEIDVQKVQFIGRVTRLPVVASALVFATDRYERIKGYNELVGSTLARAEQSVAYVAETAKPVVLKLEKPITYADQYVCQGLDKLEAKVPVIKKSPEEIYSSGWGKFEEVKKMGSDKVQVLRDYGFEKVNTALATPYGQAVVKSMDTAMDMTESAVDHYLPAADDEPQTTTPGEARERNVVQRMSSLSEKMRRRMYRQAMGQMSVFQKRSQDALQRMSHSVDLIQYAKFLEESGRKRVSVGVIAVQNKAVWLWEELKKNEDQESEGAEGQEKSFDQRLLSVARRATHEVINRYNQLSATTRDLLPENVQKSLDSSTAYAMDVYSQLQSASSLKDFSDVALKQMTTAVDSLQQTLAAVLPVLRSRRHSAPAQ